MGRMIRDEIDIAAPPERVWKEFTDFRSFPSWNPFIRKAKGKLVPGRRIRVKLRLGRKLVKVHPRLTVVDPGRELRWMARQIVPRLFDVERAFRFEGDGKHTRFVQYEIGRGLLAPVLMPILRRRIARGYAALNLALKARAER